MDLSHRMEFINVSIDLNFEINTIDLPPIRVSTIFMDFMESFCFADIFTIQLD